MTGTHLAPGSAIARARSFFCDGSCSIVERQAAGESALGRSRLPARTFAARPTRCAIHKGLSPESFPYLATGRGKPRSPARQAGPTTTGPRQGGPAEICDYTRFVGRNSHRSVRPTTSVTLPISGISQYRAVFPSGETGCERQPSTLARRRCRDESSCLRKLRVLKTRTVRPMWPRI